MILELIDCCFWYGVSALFDMNEVLVMVFEFVRQRVIDIVMILILATRIRLCRLEGLQG